MGHSLANKSLAQVPTEVQLFAQLCFSEASTLGQRAIININDSRFIYCFLRNCIFCTNTEPVSKAHTEWAESPEVQVMSGANA